MDPRPAGRVLSRVAAALVLLLILGLVSLRFWGLEERGLFGSDVVYYTHLAENWSEGERVYTLGGRRAVYRPVVLGLFAAAIEVLGFEDDSIKKLNAAADTLNVGLVFALGWLVARRRFWPAALASLTYAALPLAIYVCRAELTHSISTFFTLLTVFLAALWFQNRRFQSRRHARAGKVLLVLAGLAGAAAALSHEDLLFVSGGVLLWIVAASWDSARQGRVARTVMAAALFMLPLGIGVSGMVVHHWQHAVKLLTSNLGWQTEIEAERAAGVAKSEEDLAEKETPSIWARVGGQAEKTGRMAWNASAATMSPVVTILVLLTLTGWLIDMASTWRKREIFPFPWLEALLIAVTAVFLVSFALFFPYLFPRLFLPLTPLLLVFCSAVLGRFWAYSSASWRSWPWARWAVKVVAMCALLSVVLVSNLEQFSRRQAFMARTYADTWAEAKLPAAGVAAAIEELRETSYRTSWARQVHDLMGDQVDASSRLLVTSSLMYPHPARRDLQVGYYFGDDAVYLFDYSEPIEQLVLDFDVRWVLFSAYRADQRFLRRPEVRTYLGNGEWSELGPSRVCMPYGLPRESCRLGKEYSALMTFLDSQNAEIVHQTGVFTSGESPSLRWGDESYVIYELSRHHRSRSSASASAEESSVKPSAASTSR